MNVLIDSSVWMGHFRNANAELAGLINRGLTLSHPLIVGEIACGTPPHRAEMIRAVSLLLPAALVGMGDVMAFIERERLYGLGCGIVDMSLLASVLITPGAKLWTLDKRLAALAERFGVNFQPPLH